MCSSCEHATVVELRAMSYLVTCGYSITIIRAVYFLPELENYGKFPRGGLPLLSAPSTTTDATVDLN
jgi:hypothetical protein